MTPKQLLKKPEKMQKSISPISKSETRLRHQAQKLKRSEEEYRMMVELANNIILRMDTAGRITFINEFAGKFFGYAKKEIIGQNIIGTIAPKIESSGRDLAAFIASICRNPGEFTINENIKKEGSRKGIAKRP
ncbi:MAG: PAS domain-containing protein [Smithellaceae bacterium]